MFTTNDEINRAMVELDIATNQFNYASENFIDAAIFRMTRAEHYLNALLKTSKASELMVP